MSNLALDIGKRTGWATFSGGKFSGEQNFYLKRGESVGMLYLRFRRWLFQMKELIGDLEAISCTMSNHQGGAQKIICLGLEATVQLFTVENKIFLYGNQTAYYRKFLIDKKNDGNDQIIKAAKAWGWSPRSISESRAALLWEDYDQSKWSS